MKVSSQIFLFLLLVFLGHVLSGQKSNQSSLKAKLAQAGHDSERCQVYVGLVEFYYSKKMDSALFYVNKAIMLAEAGIAGDPSAPRNVRTFKKCLADAFNAKGFCEKQRNNFPAALEYYHKGLRLREEIDDKPGMAVSLANIAIAHEASGKFAPALEFHRKSLQVKKALKDTARIARSLMNIASVYKTTGNFQMNAEYLNQALDLFGSANNSDGMADCYHEMAYSFHSSGNILQALEFYGKALRVREAIHDKPGMAQTLNNMATVYQSQHDTANAIKYMMRSYKLREETGDKKAVAVILNNIGLYYKKLGNNNLALNYYMKSMKIREELNDKKSIATSLNNIGGLYFSQGDKGAALKYYKRSYKIRDSLGLKEDLTYSLINIGRVHYENRQYAAAEESISRAMKLGQELGNPHLIKNAALFCVDIYKAKGNYRLALDNYELYIKMRDSISNESTRKATIKSQLKYDYEKQAAADSVAHAKESEIKNAEIAKQTAEIRAKRNQQYALFGGLGLVMIFAGFMFNRFKVTQKQKEIIESQKEIVEEQKKLVEEKQKEILDSIHYARRIQMAQIPSEKRVEQNLTRLRKK